MSKRILYVRSGPYEVSLDAYNLQELGLACELCKRGYIVDVMYYTKGKSRDETITRKGEKINILWRRGIKFLRSGIYPSILKKDILSKYDIVICSEYSQLMSILLLQRHHNVYIYNGPYYNLFRIKPIEKIYDKLFCNYINKKSKKIFCKTKMSEKYLNNKGITNTVTVGVGLDTDIFDKKTPPDKKTKKILSKMRGHKNILYIGSISKRKNVEFITKTFNTLCKKQDIKNLQLVIIGNGSSDYISKCKSSIEEQNRKKVIWLESISNAMTQYIYKASDVFLLASTEEIFGMVLLEAMYFGNIVISSNTAGAQTLIKNNYNGFVIDSYDTFSWERTITRAITGDYSKIKHNAEKTIRDIFSWSNIANTINKYIIKG